MHVITKPETFRAILEAVATLVDEARIHFNDDHIAIRAVDPANVAMVDLEFDTQEFESYDADDVVLGVALDRLLTVINHIESQPLEDVLLSITLDEDTRKLTVEGGQMDYSVALIDPDSIRKEPDIPTLDLPAEVTSTGNWITEGINAADGVSDHITLGVDPDDEEFYMAAEGDTDDWKLGLTESDGLINLTSGDAHSIYSLEYFKNVRKAFPSDAEITLELGEEFPVKVKFVDRDGNMNLEYMIAPRIQD